MKHVSRAIIVNEQGKVLLGRRVRPLGAGKYAHVFAVKEGHKWASEDWHLSSELSSDNLILLEIQTQGISHSGRYKDTKYPQNIKILKCKLYD